MPTQEQLLKLWNVCERFIKDYDIDCADHTHHTDIVLDYAEELMEEICDIVGYAPYVEG